MQHAVTKYIAGHITDADYADVVAGLDILAHFAKMAFDRLPGAPCGDTHFLMVVADRTARSEGITQPETVFGGNAISNIRKRGGAFIRRDYQIRIVTVVAYHLCRGDDAASDPIIGDVQHAAHEGLVAGDGFLLQCFSLGGRLFEHKAAFGADRYDDGIFDDLRLH